MSHFVKYLIKKIGVMFVHCFTNAQNLKILSFFVLYLISRICFCIDISH